MAYVYRHIRLDKNVPFYIGIGGDDEYKRANTKLSRNKYWENIVNKTHFEVDILIDDIDWESACVKEKEFISLYKRRKDGGTLCNLTLGGEGQCGMIPWNFGKETSEETRKKQSLKKQGKPNGRKGTPCPPHVKEAMIKGLREKGAWNKGLSMPKEWRDKFMKSMEGKFLKGENHPMYGKKMSQYVKDALREANKNREPWNKGKKGYKVPNANRPKKIVEQYTLLGEFVTEYPSVTEATIGTPFSKCGISGCATGRIKFHLGYIWKYKDAV